ncbi:MAG: ligase-associated DNA damage response endonuclease PdeM [Flavobacteriales bacterium]|nr:ligase-associated DNA damage response endonuclease PdeM [Flavobacteriales bacterium]
MQEYVLKGQTFVLYSNKTIWWKEADAILVADLHFGKVTHFRKAGISVPNDLFIEDLLEIKKILDQKAPQKLIILGDLFHSDHNHEWKLFNDLVSKFPKTETHLVLGNHDERTKELYEGSIINVHDELCMEPFHFTHETYEHPDLYNLSGHVHPAIKMRGKARQSLRLPCFYFGEKFGILPAFGSFTGSATIKPKKDDQVFAVVNDSVLVL